MSAGPGCAMNRPMKVIHVSAGQSPLMGCLFALGILVVVALLIAGAGVAAIVVPVVLVIWRIVRFFFPPPAPASGEMPERTHSSSPDVIDVEVTVLPPALKDERARDEERR